MIPSEFSYHKAKSVDEALQLLSQHEDAKFLAGGQSLLAAMKLRLNAPTALIDIGGISDLSYIRDEGDAIAIGAATTHDEIANSSLIQDRLPVYSSAAGMIGDPAVRNVGTIGGSLAHADPAADWPAPLLATDATIVVKGPGGTRNIASADFFEGLYMTALAEDELITEIRIPSGLGNTGKLTMAYSKFKQPASRFAIVGCAVVMSVDRGPSCTFARVAFTGVADKAFRDHTVEGALTNSILSDENIANAAAQAAEGVDVLGDHFASEAYRKQMAKVYARRAISAAASQ